MKLFDSPRKWWVYRWAHHFWVLSFNRNSALYRVVWWSKYTRPIIYNTAGRVRGSEFGPVKFFIWFWIIVLIGAALKLI